MSMSSALQELKQKYPSLSAAEVMNALKKSKGDPARAMELLKQLGSGTSTAASALPDLRSDPEGWFRHYDRDGNGLERHEVIEAVCETFHSADRTHVLDVVNVMWSTFDPDGSGAISLKEFLQRDGLRDTLLASLGGAATTPTYHSAHPPHAGHPAECKPGRPTAAAGHPAGHRPSASYPASPMGRPSAPPAQFHLGHDGASKSPGGRHRALLIGINYFGTRAQLRGCINDVKNVHSLLTETYGWDPRNIRTLTDDSRSRSSMPTRANIEAAMKWLVHGAQPGDSYFFSFSGHGAQQPDPHGYEEDGMNETILPVDFKTAGMISDDIISEIMVRHLPEGVRLTAVMDCCHSGTGLDLPYSWTRRGWREETNPYHCAADVQLFSGCEDDDTSSDASSLFGAAGGAMTTAFCDTLRATHCPTYPQLISNLNKLLRRRGFRQCAQLTSTQHFDIDRPFLLSDAIPNSNPCLGRTVRRKFPPRARRMHGPLAEMLGLGAAAVGGLVLADMAGDLLGGLIFG